MEIISKVSVVKKCLEIYLKTGIISDQIIKKN